MFVLKKAAYFAGALAVSALLALSPAKAVSVTSSGVSGGCDTAIAGGFGQIDVFAGASWNATFDNGDAGGVCAFDLWNNSATTMAVTVAVATVNQGGATWGFRDMGGGSAVDLVSAVFPTWSLAEGVAGAQTFSFLIAAGNAVNFDWFWGTAYSTSAFVKPDIDFTVFATPVPVPAALPLLLTGLAGLGWLARRRKATAKV